MQEEKKLHATRLKGLDPLTKLHTRQTLYQSLMNLSNSRDAQMPTSFVMFNVRSMLHYNNMLSCSDGDIILQSVANIIQQHLPEGGIAGRWNGKAFGVILPFCPASISKPWAAMVAQAANKLKLPVALPSYLQSINVVWSIATSPPHRLSTLPQQAENQLLEKDWKNTIDLDRIFIPREELPYAQDIIFLLLSTKSPHLKEFTIASLYYCQAIGQAIHLSQEDLIHLRTAALWQDVGLLQVPLDTLIKSGPITLQERDLIRQHVQYSTKWAQNFGVPPETLKIILHHHEKWDGTGYPSGLAGNHIPLGSRILKIASSWTKLQQHLFWQRQTGQTNALQEINAKKNLTFDGELVEILNQLAPELPTPDEINMAYRQENQKAVQ